VRARAILGALAGAALLAGCAGIPASGPVQSGGGHAIVADPLVPVAPVPGASDDPLTLTDNFIQACAAGVSGTFSAAEAYLTPSAQLTWDPTATVTVFGSGDFGREWNADTNTVTYNLPVVATVDDAGVFTEANAATPLEVTFHMSQDADGRWRISGLDDGIVLAEAHFQALYRSVLLEFASQDGRFFVPELRWVPRTNAATFAATALINGPSPWLADAVHTGVPAAAKLTVRAVPVSAGDAAVSLDTGGGVTAADLALAERQFAETLIGLPDISTVSVIADGLPISASSSPINQAPAAGTTAVAFVDGRLGSWSPDGLEVALPSVGRLPEGASSPALAYDGTVAAFLIDGTSLVTTDALGRGTVPYADAGDLPDDVMQVTTLYTGTALTTPSFDWYGWIWTAERDSDGEVIAMAPDGTPQHIAASWLEGREVASVRVSRDGARIGVLSRDGGVWRLDVAGIVRDAEGNPLSVGEPLSVGTGIGPSSHLVWVDEMTLAVLADGPEGTTPSLGISTVGGGTEVVSSSADAIELAARNGTSSIAVVTRTGEIFQRSTAGWSRVQVDGAVDGLAFSG